MADPKVMLLTRDAILAAPDLPERDVEVPEWGGVVRVRGLSGTERDAFEETISASKNGKRIFNGQDFRAKLIGRAIVDEEGNRMFSDGDVKALGMKSAKALERVFDAAAELSGMTETSVESLSGNLDDQSGASTTD